FPSSPVEPGAADWFVEHGDAVRVGAFLLLGSAIALGIFCATTVSRLNFLGVQVAGSSIALLGGIGASITMMVAALLQWVLALGPIDILGTAPLVTFAMGGVGFIAALGLFIAGVSISAGLLRLVPRWLMWFGLVTAVIAELATLSLIVPYFIFLIPAARLLGFVWIIALGALLPKT